MATIANFQYGGDIFRYAALPFFLATAAQDFTGGAIR